MIESVRGDDPGSSTLLLPSGASLRCIDLLDLLPEQPRAALAQSLATASVAISGSPRAERGEPRRPVTAAISLVERVLTRGTRPPIHPAVEQRLLREAGFKMATLADRDDREHLIDPDTPLPSEWDVLEVAAWMNATGETHLGRTSAAPPRLAPVVVGPTQFLRLSYALLVGLDRGWLAPDDVWSLDVRDSLGIADWILPTVLELFSAASALCGQVIAPRECRCRLAAERSILLRSAGPGSFEILPFRRGRFQPDLEIVLEPEKEPVIDPPSAGRTPRIVVRSSTEETPESSPSDLPLELPPDSTRVHAGLEWMLVSLFGHRGFLPGQVEAVEHVLRGRDCALSLPPGGGKSLVYQMLGILLPGTTMVVGPTEAHVSSQLADLARHGLDACVSLSRDSGPGTGVTNPRAAFTLVNATELRSSSGRAALRSRAADFPPGLVVVDEAQRASEWSVDFDPRLFPLGSALTSLGSVHQPPRLLALMTTGSRNVVRDVVSQIAHPEEPHTFLEAETKAERHLPFKVVHARPETALQELRSVLAGLPKRYRMPSIRFFDPKRTESRRGLVLCSRPDGPLGPLAVREVIRESGLCARIGLYSGATPPGLEPAAFEESKSRDLRDMRNGDLTLMVATCDLPLGPDLRRIDYIICCGVPESLFSLQRLVGRLRRAPDGTLVVVHISQSEGTLRKLLKDGVEHSSLCSAMKRHGDIFAEPDDLMRSLGRLCASFPGIEEEIAEAGRLLRSLNEVQKGSPVEVPSGSHSSATRRAICRLQAVGIVSDWVEESDGSRFEITVAKRSDASREEKFWQAAFVADPSYVQQVEIALLDDSGSPQTPSTWKTSMARLQHLLQIVYSTVPRERRAAIAALAELVGRKGEREIPTLPLIRGSLAKSISELTARRPSEVRSWLELLGSAGTQDTNEIEAALEELDRDPESADAGIELARALLALLQQQRTTFRVHLTEALSRTRRECGDDWELLQALFWWIMPRARALAPELKVEVWRAWEEAGGEFQRNDQDRWPSHLLRASAIRSLSEPSQTPPEAVIALERRLREACSILDTLREHFVMEEADL